jgi:hypothetical protein
MDKGIDTLIASISEQIDGLKNGTLTVSQLNELTEQSREVYEILVVLRFSKASKSSNNTNLVKEEQAVQVIKEEVVIETAKEASTPDEAILFDFSGASEVQETPEEIDLFAPTTPPVIEVKQQESQEIVEPVTTPVKEDKEELEDSSINKNYHNQFSNSIASRMELQPIKNIAGHISLNQRFTFISNLFGNNAEAYNQQIAELDQFPNDAAAKQRLIQLKDQYQWDLENKQVEEFVTIVERRYL